MTIVEKIRASIQRVHGEGFAVYYHDDPTMNLIADTMTLPAAIVQLITQGELDQQSGQWREVVSAVVFFVDRSDTRLLRPWDFPGKSTGMGAIAFSA